MSTTTSISRPYVQAVCRFGQAEDCCAFLMMGGAGFECAKGTGIEATIRERLAVGSMNAKGDHCAGWLTVDTTPDVPFDPPDPEFDPRDDMHIDCCHDDSDGPAWRS